LTIPPRVFTIFGHVLELANRRSRMSRRKLKLDVADLAVDSLEMPRDRRGSGTARTQALRNTAWLTCITCDGIDC